MTQPSPDLVSTLLAAALDLTGLDIADALWLSKVLPASTPTQSPDQQEDQQSGAQGSSATSSPSSSPPAPPSVAPPMPQTPVFTKPRRSDNLAGGSDRVPAVAVRSPKGSALPNQRQIELALRPLKRWTPSRIEFELDEEVTAESFAEQYLAGMRILLPVLRPVQKRWLEVALIVDCSNSMVIWQETARDLGQLLVRQGFRDVHLWQIDTQAIDPQNLDPQSPAVPQVFPFKRDRTSAQPAVSRELIPRRDCLFLLLTDCVAPAWQTRRIFPLLAEWGKYTSVTLLQVWTERLWSRTILRDISFFVSECQPALPNVHLSAERWSESFTESLTAKPKRHGVLIPVVELEPKSLANWARMITGAKDIWLPALEVSNFPADEVEPDKEEPVPAKQRNPQEWVELFRATASPLAQRLAGLLASTHLTLSVIRLVQNALLPEAKLAHLSEVLTSGLMYRLGDDGRSSPDEPVFDFIPGARNLLRRRVTVSDTLQVLVKVGEFIRRKAGQGEGFAARVPDAAGTEFMLNGQTLPFARIEEEVLHSLGPIYRARVQQLHEQIIRFEESILSLETFTFDVVEFVEEEPLPQFEFETVTVNAKGEIIQRSPHQQTYYFVEALGQELRLEMVAIPGGSFEMGSPKDESKRHADEDPQHSVAVQPFFMGKYAVTQAQWRFVAGLEQVNRELESDPSRFKGDDRPVEQVSWNDVVEFCDRLSAHTGRIYRLPSEAEWEYACRAGTSTPFYFGETITAALANYDGNYTYREEAKGDYREQTTPVGSFPPNAFGLYDMHGNVWEWCGDRWHENYKGAPEDGSVWLKQKRSVKKDQDEISYVLRGGSWNYDPDNCRSAFRNHLDPVIRDYSIGFRVVSSASRT